MLPSGGNRRQQEKAERERYVLGCEREVRVMNALEKITEQIKSMKNDIYETLKEERKRHGESKTAEELESYIYGLTSAEDIIEKYRDEENEQI